MHCSLSVALRRCATPQRGAQCARSRIPATVIPVHGLLHGHDSRLLAADSWLLASSYVNGLCGDLVAQRRLRMLHCARRCFLICEL